MTTDTKCRSQHCYSLHLHYFIVFFFSSRRRHTRLVSDWSSDVCSSDLLTARKLTGLALGLAGLALLLGEGLGGIGKAPLGSLLVVGAALSWALGVVLQKRFPVTLAPGPYTAWIMLLGGVPIFIGALLLEDFRVLAQVGLWPALGVAYNVLVAFAFAHWAWIKIATAVSVTVFSLSMLLIPVVGVLSGMLFLGERPTMAEYGAALLVLCSLATVVF